MPMVHNHLPNETDQITAYKTATHDSGPQIAPTETHESNQPFTVPLDKQTHPAQGRFSVSWSGITSALKANVGWICFGVFLFTFEIISSLFFGKPMTLSTSAGEVLRTLTMVLAFAHINDFKGRTRQSWLVSWLFRFVVFFASFSVPTVARHPTWSLYFHLIPAFLIATGTVAWQYSKRNQPKPEDTAEQYMAALRAWANREEPK